MMISIADSGCGVTSARTDDGLALKAHLSQTHLLLANHVVEFLPVFVDGELDGVIQRSRHLERKELD